MAEFYSHGKLLISGEYAVLDGVKALAVPTKSGQSLKMQKVEEPGLSWKSFDEQGEIWFEAQFTTSGTSLSIELASDYEIAQRLADILNKAASLSKSSIDLSFTGVETHLEFHRHWGLGSSSTLINNIASWFDIDAFELLQITFGGSGYDIACAQNASPLIYQVSNQKPEVSLLELNWSFKEHLYFVYLNAKQNSRSGISDYRKRNAVTDQHKIALNAITEGLIASADLHSFEILIKEHNTLISALIGQPPISETLFKDFQGTVKNLGAWGGDFMLVACEMHPKEYFNSKGFHTILPYAEMVL